MKNSFFSTMVEKVGVFITNMGRSEKCRVKGASWDD